jgi:copper chaperone NosL
MLQKLSKRNRFLILAAVGILLLIFFLPIWYIGLIAPQYPDGLSMAIWINRITGGTEYDLNKINLLNHYVGMKTILPESFIEFKYMPYVLAFLALGTLVTFFFHRIITVIINLSAFVLAGGAGFYVFWKWEYDYGHNLDPQAPYKFPGMYFQPPLIACKDMMNITACSWPHIGGILMFLAGGILIYVLYDEMKKKKLSS